MAALPFGEPAPHAEAFVVGQREVEALCAYGAEPADGFGGGGGAAFAGEERFGVGLGAERINGPVLSCAAGWERESYRGGQVVFG